MGTATHDTKIESAVRGGGGAERERGREREREREREGQRERERLSAHPVTTVTSSSRLC